MPVLHPCPDDDGQPVTLHLPSAPTGLAAWMDAAAIATVVPGGAMPAALNGIAFDAWAGAAEGAWDALANDAADPEPPFVLPPGLAAAAGAVIVEEDGRVWLVAPSNGFGGYDATFPKGRVDAGTSLRCAAVREAFEESGLKVEIDGFLIDVRRTLTYTRYYLARRVGGHPGTMGWESQAVHLVPLAMLAEVATHRNDVAIIAALLSR
ncbi:ADP-ribose pyrophosphatase YjhB (NUDIX family) [Pseudoduganella lurida]|uniref:ADP-ribose pyrophosphatase YjhB (NUDIX family) n=1 Tax=Pseudoduganella lurida TaxID=1036180 RepID=A0A562RKY5_9BURK|nr:NUDIX hydrolase [Pseudoduganella lurida]TWI69708.1 ADP-ribose pyrophosphatase YjhB (NUDIX family) [Pseudoduganella lurida]